MIVGEPDGLRELYEARGPGIEQDAWLGWGCVFLLATGLVFPPRFNIPRGYFPLIWSIVALAIIAVSPWVRLGTRVFDFSFLLPDAIVDLYAIHRATVRFAWPLVISISLLALAHFVLAWPRRLAVPILGIAFALQVYSIWPYWAYEYRDARVAVTCLAPPPTILTGGVTAAARGGRWKRFDYNTASTIRDAVGCSVRSPARSRMVCATAIVRPQSRHHASRAPTQSSGEVLGGRTGSGEFPGAFSAGSTSSRMRSMGSACCVPRCVNLGEAASIPQEPCKSAPR